MVTGNNHKIIDLSSIILIEPYKLYYIDQINTWTDSYLRHANMGEAIEMDIKVTVGVGEAEVAEVVTTTTAGAEEGEEEAVTIVTAMTGEILEVQLLT